MESEKKIELHLTKEIKKIGGRAYKFLSPGASGVPDRLVCLPGGRTVFVELKSEGQKSTTQQKHRQEELRALGFAVFADVDTKSKVDAIVRILKDEIHTA